MALRTQISERQRRFGAELRRLREAASLSVKDAGALIGIAGPQLSHIEAARTGLDPERLTILLEAYGCTDGTYSKLLHGLGTSNGKGWWSAFKGKVPALALDLAEAEDRSEAFAVFDALYIPGTLQVPGYVEAIYKGAYKDGRWDTATAIEFRLQRQRIITDSKQRQFRYVIHEAALRMQFAGKSVMREQLLHLVDMAELPNVTIEILPFDALGRAPYAGAFLICDPGCTDLSTIILDGPKRAVHLGDPDDVAAYHQMFQEARDHALPVVDTTKPRRDSSRDSWGLLQHILYELQH
ncbi:transcriptional regulator [Kitasatospora xanthocidica]|uniref:helix-turn-helix domain-containing protein n=1 Tax=Kitasatospora xanthocidica TaxID=83382 RepID=UPI0016759BAE|nr:helix-turn-helix transcriptional regulator [Kitasatospora xanthocidica]GHF85712.1 transcriptional regulator [Kitasatospora xanthocidica]